MRKKRIEVLQSYADTFRELVNARVWGKEEEPSKALRLSLKSDWSFVCVAMDVVSDASLAIESFLQFGLDGPSRHDDVGERYLRLYGLLSAAYVQQQAVLKLFSLMNCPNPKSLKAEFDKLELRTLRHQLASHSLDFKTPEAAAAQAFVPVRIGLNGFSCMVTENRGDRTRTVKLDEAIDSHCRKIVDAIDTILEKSIGTIFRGYAKRIKEFKEKLADLRSERDGNLIVRGPDGNKVLEIRTVFVKPNKQRRITSRSTRSRVKRAPG